MEVLDLLAVAMLDKVPGLSWNQAYRAAEVAVAIYALAQHRSGTSPKGTTLSFELTRLLEHSVENAKNMPRLV